MSTANLSRLSVFCLCSLIASLPRKIQSLGPHGLSYEQPAGLWSCEGELTHSRRLAMPTLDAARKCSRRSPRSRHLIVSGCFSWRCLTTDCLQPVDDFDEDEDQVLEYGEMMKEPAMQPLRQLKDSRQEQLVRCPLTTLGCE